MLAGWTVVAVALIYIGFLFAIASYGDRLARKRRQGAGRPVIYALSLAVYCTSWTFFGSVGLSAASGMDFLAIYIGPIAMMALGWPVLLRIVTISKQQNITSIADFIAARYGKTQGLGALVAVIAVIGILPYISLQLKAVSASLTVFLGSDKISLAWLSVPVLGDLALVVALAMAAFAILFGTRHIDATEHQDGLVLAVATESVVKLFAFITVGVFVTYFMFDGLGALFEQAAQRPDIVERFTGGVDGARWITMTLLASIGILLLPRQFHVAVVENDNVADIRKAAWLFPLYLVAINVFVVPIALAGLLTFEPGSVNPDMFVLALPMAGGQEAITLIAFIGGLSAATAMVIVAAVALAIMVSNELVMPIILRNRDTKLGARRDMGSVLLHIRRMAIVAVLVLAYFTYRVLDDSLALASLGLISFAAIAQFAPAFFGGLVWRRATAKGAIAGITAGFLVWAYTLLLPAFADTPWFPETLLDSGPLGIAALTPQALLGVNLDPLSHGVFWSLLANVAAYVGLSLASQPQPIERLQANLFVNADLPSPAQGFRLWRTTVSVDTLKATVARYLGDERSDRSFAEFASARGVELHGDEEADIRLLRFAEHLLASAVGAASARLVLALLLERHSLNARGAMRLLDDASAAIQHNRDLLQSALEHVGQGIAVFDRDLRLICWNRQYRELLELPADLGRVGVPLQEIIRFNAARGDFGDDDVEDIVSDRIEKFVVTMERHQERMEPNGTVLEVRPNSMPDGGIVVTFADITDKVEAAEALTRINETLERRVRERTAELTALNSELERARAAAEEANIGKTRFLAAASHDILQPLNAARLYATSLAERERGDEDGSLIRKVDASLEAVEDILGALLDISRLDAGALKPELSTFRIDELLSAMATEFEALAAEKGIALKTVPCGLSVRSDRRLVRRVLQNLVSNAVKYTDRGGVLLGCRRRGDMLRIEVHDTGPGIPTEKRRSIFEEFQRLDAHGATPGLGLGLSIVERIVQMLDHDIAVASRPGHGSTFALTLPIAEASPAVPAGPAASRPLAANVAGLVVLCIDNEPEILDGMCLLLEGWGCRALCARDGTQALDLIDAPSATPDVIIADYHLEAENGLDLIGVLRARLGRDVPALLVTADRSGAVKRDAAARGVVVLNKPVKPAALRALIAQSGAAREAAE